MAATSDGEMSDERVDELAELRARVERLEHEQEDLYSVLDTVAYLLERRIERALEERMRAAS